MSKILGISAFYHDSAATLIDNGNIVGAAQEERFSRKKHDDRFPINAIKFLLKNSSLTLNEIDKIVFYEKPLLSWSRMTYFSMQKPFQRWKINSQQFKKIWNDCIS